MFCHSATRLFFIIIIICLTVTPANAEVCRNYGDYMSWTSIMPVSNSGTAYDVDGDTQMAFGAFGDAGLGIIDLSTPDQPFLRGTLSGIGTVTSVLKDGDFAWCATTTSGLLVIDAQDSDDPVELSHLSVPAVDLAMNRNDILVAGGTANVLTICARDTESPYVRHTVILPGAGLAVALNDDESLALVACGGSGFVIVDIEAATPEIIFSVPAPAGQLVKSVAWYGSHIFAGTASSIYIHGKLVIYGFDGSNEPELINEVFQGSWPRDLKINDDVLWLAIDYSGVRVLDITIPSEPELIHQVITDGYTDGGLMITAGHCYVPTSKSYQGTCGLETIRISDFNQRQAYKTFPTEDDAIAVSLRDGWAYSLDYGGELTTINLATESVANVMDLGADSSNMTIADDLLLVVHDSEYMSILDLGIDPVVPTLLSTTYIADVNYLLNVVAHGNYAYITDYGAIHIVDISDPGAPVRVGGISNLSTCRKMIIVEDLLVVGTMNGSFDAVQTYDLAANPMVPVLISEIVGVLNRNIIDLDYSAGILYTAHTDGLTIFDFQNPSAPALLGSLNTPRAARAIAVSGNTVYLGGDFGCGTFIVNASNLNEPFVVGTIAPNLEAFSGTVDILLYDEMVIIADSDAGTSLSYRQCGDQLSASPSVPEVFSVTVGNHPNPFNPQTTISYTLPDQGLVSVGVFDLAGKRVTTLRSEFQLAGDHSVIWNGRDGNGHIVAGGIYLARVVQGEDTAVRKMILLK